MEEKEVKIGDKTFVIRELKYKELTGIGTTDQAVLAQKLIQLSTNISDEEYDNLSMKVGIELTTEINKLNGIDTENFRQKTESQDKS